MSPAQKLRALLESKGIYKQALSLMKQHTALQEGFRRNHGRSYSGDPRWITAKHDGVDKKGTPIKRGDRVFYYPNSNTIFAGEAAEAAARDFQAAVQDDYFG